MKMKTSLLLVLCISLAACTHKLRIAKDPAEITRWSQDAEHYVQEKNYTQASHLYRQIALNQSEPGEQAATWFKLGIIEMKQADYSAARSAFEACLKSDTNYDKAWANLALINLMEFRKIAPKAIRSASISMENREAFTLLLQDVERALGPASGKTP